MHMCKPVRNGGKRCPVHQHQNIAAIKVAAHLGGLTRYQGERLFAELRREGRTSEVITAEQHEASLNSVLAASVGTPMESVVKAELVKSRLFDKDIDGATAYAQRLILARAAYRGAKLNVRFDAVAQRTGFTSVEIAAKYKEFMDGVDTSRNAAVDPEFNQNTRRHAEDAGLPYDRASVVALEKLNTLSVAAPTRRVTHEPAAYGSHLFSYGYDEGRLEIVFGSNPEKTYAYHNVPEGVWVALSESHSPGTIFARQIRGNEDYQYANEEESEADAFAVRCASCGQFRAVAHSCPEREMRAELEAEGLTAEEIVEVTNNVNNVDEIETVEPVVVVDEGPTDEEILVSLSKVNAELVEAARQESLLAEEPEFEGRVEFEPLNDDGSTQDDTEDDVAEDVEEPEPDVPVRARRLTRAQVEAEAPVAEFVLAAPEMESANPWVFRDDSTGEPIDLSQSTSPVTEPLPDVYDYVATSQNQFVPEKYDKNKLLILEGGQYPQANIVDSTTARWRVNGLQNRMSPEEYQKIMDAPKEISHVLVTDTDSKVTVMHTYDSREITGNAVYLNNQERVDWQKPYTYKLHRIGKRHPDLVFTADERAEANKLENEKLQKLVDSDEAVIIPQNATETRKYTFDANLSEQPHIKIGKSTTFKQAIKQGKVAITPVSIRLSNPTRRGANEYVDDQGYQFGADHSTVITGEVAMRKNSAGVMENISGKNKLKCSCYNYRTNYYCQHINYVERHIGNVAQQMIYVAPRTANPDEPSRHRLMSATLANRSDAKVVETTDPAESYVSFGKSLGYNVRVDMTYHLNRRLRVPASLANMSVDNPSFEEIEKLYAHRLMNNSINSISVPSAPSALRTAIKRSNIEVPISVRYDTLNSMGRRSYGRDIKVEGAVMFAKTTGDLEDAAIISNTLKCSCAEYKEKYDCPHVRYTLEQSFAIIGAGGRQEATDRSALPFVRLRYDALNREEEVLRSMRDTGLDREATVRKISVRVEAERIQREEREREAVTIRAANQARREEALRQQQELTAKLNKKVLEGNAKFHADLMKRDEDHDETYASNPKKFFDTYKKALKRKADGEEPIPYKTENVIDSGTGPGARKFGVELEFVISSSVNREDALRNIAKELNEAGLTESSYQQSYHAAASQNSYHAWSFEDDCTVHGELVSPILDDSPESWRQLKVAVEIIKKNGGVTNTKCGSHVHVSSSSYGMSTAKNAELLRQTNQDQDIINRLSSNPKTGVHRGRQWCKPNAIDEAQDVNDTVQEGHDILGWRAAGVRETAINFNDTSKSNLNKSHIEFRAWDGTLDASVIQQQIAVSVALLDRAERSVIKNGGSKKPTIEAKQIGSGKTKEKLTLEKHSRSRAHSEDSFFESEAEHGAFFDSLFRKDEHRESAVALFAITNWQD